MSRWDGSRYWADLRARGGLPRLGIHVGGYGGTSAGRRRLAVFHMPREHQSNVDTMAAQLTSLVPEGVPRNVSC
jgi:hypothetical protein